MVRGINIAKYVEYNSETNKSTCLYENCGQILSGKKLFNIKRHYSTIHNKEIDESHKKVLKIKRSSENETEIRCDMNKEKFLKCCVGLVTNEILPLEAFDDHEFLKELIEPYEEVFNIKVNSKNIGLLVEKSKRSRNRNVK